MCIRDRKESLARLATIEMGKRIAESRGEVEISAAILDYYAKNAEKFLAPRELNSVMGDAHIEFSPIGVLIGIQPWNYPYYQLARFAAPNLMAGNVVLLKHAPEMCIRDRALGISLTTVKVYWTFARTWILHAIEHS